MEQLRDETKSSTYVNSAVAGAAAGAVIGSMKKRIDIMASTALCLGILMGMVEFNGQKPNAVSEHSAIKWNTILPATHEETRILQDLKKKYPEYKNS
jgi:hypothetical protein